jgi:hypothetical protein
MSNETTTSNEALNVANVDTTPAIGHNLPPIAMSIDVADMFKRADADETRSFALKTTAETRCAVAILAYYHQKNAELMSAGTLWKLDRRVGKEDFDEQRSDMFRAEFKDLCGIKAPVKSESRIIDDSYTKLNDEYVRRDKLVTRGLQLACDMVMSPNKEDRLTAEAALSWYDAKSGLFVVPYTKVMKKHQFPTGVLGMRVFGSGKPGTASHKPGNDDTRVKLDGGVYSASTEDGKDEIFKADTSRIKVCALSMRVKIETQIVTDPVTGKQTEVQTEVPIEAANTRESAKQKADAIAKAKAEADAKAAADARANAAKAPSVPDPNAAKTGNASGGGRPEGSASTAAGISFETAVRTLIGILSEPVDEKAPAENRYWSKFPYASQVENLINKLTELKNDMVAFESTHTAEVARKAAEQEANRKRVAAERKAAAKAELAATADQRKA